MQQLAKLLTPVIITYNRSNQLLETLNAFLQAGFASTPCYVLDNASTDDTAIVVKKIQAQWPALRYERNAYNIGGNANILRSVELSDTPYHWVIGDDDHWLLRAELIAELLQVLQTNKADVVRLGWLAEAKSRGQFVLGHELAKEEQLFFASVSMISATIIRRSIVTRYLGLAYQNISDFYPQLIPVIKAVENDHITVYTLSGDLLVHTPSTTPGFFYGDLEWYAGWFRTARFFTKKSYATHFVNEVTHYMCRDKPGKWRQFFLLLKVMLYYTSFRLNQWPYLFAMFCYGVGWRMQIALLMFIKLLTPVKLLVFMRNIYFKWKGVTGKTIQVDKSRF